MILRTITGEKLWPGGMTVTLTLECGHINTRLASAYRGHRQRCYTCEALGPLVRAAMMSKRTN